MRREPYGANIPKCAKPYYGVLGVSKARTFCVIMLCFLSGMGRVKRCHAEGRIRVLGDCYERDKFYGFRGNDTLGSDTQFGVRMATLQCREAFGACQMGNCPGMDQPYTGMRI